MRLSPINPEVARLSSDPHNTGYHGCSASILLYEYYTLNRGTLTFWALRNSRPHLPRPFLTLIS